MSKSLLPHGPQHTSLICPSPSPGVCSNSFPLSRWCHPTISSSVVPFSSCLLPFPKVSGKDLSQYQGLFQWVSSSRQVARVLEFQLQYLSFQWISRVDFFRIDWFALLAIQGTFRSLLQHHSSKASILWCSAFFIVQLSHLYMTSEKTILLTIQTFGGKVMPVLYNMLSGLVIAFFPRSKCLLISWLQSLSRVIQFLLNWDVLYSLIPKTP